MNNQSVHFERTLMAYAISKYIAVEICIGTQGESCFPQNDAWVNFRIETQCRIPTLELDVVRQRRSGECCDSRRDSENRLMLLFIER
jgi:hypothetical protein